MPELSPVLSLPFIQPAQAQKHVTHNEAIEILDIVVQLRLVDVALDTPPLTPAEGQTWAIGAAPTGAWVGMAGQIASWRAGGWMFVAPQEGWQAWVDTTNSVQVFDGSTWVPSGGSGGTENLPGVGVNATSDATNRLSVSSPAVLLNHEGAGHQLKINKSSASETGSLLYQTGFSGRAEMGLAGSDDFLIRASADGTTWATAVTIPAATGAVRVEQLLQLTPRSAPASGSAGDIYFDSATSKLRCHDGTVWQDLF